MVKIIILISVLAAISFCAARAGRIVRVGALRQRKELVPRRQGFVRSQQAWVSDIASMPKFDGMPPR